VGQRGYRGAKKKKPVKGAKNWFDGQKIKKNAQGRGEKRMNRWGVGMTRKEEKDPVTKKPHFPPKKRNFTKQKDRKKKQRRMIKKKITPFTKKTQRLHRG